MVVNSPLTTLPRDIFDSTIADIRHNLIGIRVRLNDFISFTGYSSTSFMINDHDKKNYTLKDFYPLKFLDQNSASDVGLYNILEYIFKKKKEGYYMPILVDVGIYWRLLKWIYNPFNYISGIFRQYSIWLGFWHTYKELSTIIYRESLKFLYSPIFSKMYSKSAILLKPKLTVIEKYNKFILSSYEKISNKLKKKIIKYEDFPVKYKILIGKCKIYFRYFR